MRLVEQILKCSKEKKKPKDIEYLPRKKTNLKAFFKLLESTAKILERNLELKSAQCWWWKL